MANKDNRTIVVLDMGINGMSVLNLLKRELVEETFVYINDLDVDNYEGMEIDDIDYQRRMSAYVSFGLFILGMIILILAYALENTVIEIIREFLLIIGWVVLWDLVEDIIFTDNKRKLDRLNKLQLYDSKVEFVFDRNK